MKIINVIKKYSTITVAIMGFLGAIVLGYQFFYSQQVLAQQVTKNTKEISIVKVKQKLAEVNPRYWKLKELMRSNVNDNELMEEFDDIKDTRTYLKAQERKLEE